MSKGHDVGLRTETPKILGFMSIFSMTIVIWGYTPFWDTGTYHIKLVSVIPLYPIIYIPI